LSEYSILYPCLDPDPQGNCLYLQDEKGNDFDQQRVQDWLVATTTFLESATDSRIGNPLDGGRLVQQWAWFSINNAGGVGDVSDLVDFAEADDRLTALGQQYQVLAANLAAYVNLTPAGVPAMTAETAIQGGTVDVPLRANIVNNGSVPVTGAFQVTFYADSALTQIIGQAEVAAPDANDPVLANCALRTVPVSVSWPGLAAGMHPFWVELDSQQDVEESTEDDNVTSSFVLVNPRRVSLPNISR
jgi:hypothetical protein